MAIVNLYSDTQTRPTPAMRKAMAEAEVGDEQAFADPTVTALCERVADLLGFEDAVYLPSGTMCNALAMRVHIRPSGDAILLHPESHPMNAEAGSPATFAGALTMPLDGPKGMFTGEMVENAIGDPSARWEPRVRLVSVEQTTNLTGGRVWPLDQLRGVVDAGKKHNLRLHLDGARLLNAVVASGIPAKEWTQGFDTAWIDFSKGLGAPVGACLAGSKELIKEAWRYKQMIGGAMRQAGIIAAGALYALDHHVDRLAEDHDNARLLAEELANVTGIEIDPSEVETNIVIFRVADAPEFTAKLKGEGVLMSLLDNKRVRAVTHLDIDVVQVRQAAAVAKRVLAA